MPNVLIVRGHLATAWELRPWRELTERFDVKFLQTRSNGFEVASVNNRKPKLTTPNTPSTRAAKPTP